MRRNTIAGILTLGLLAAMAASGCAPAAGGRIGPKDLLTDAQQRQYAGRFWVDQGVPPITADTARHVAVAEFTVEFVQQRVEGPLDPAGGAACRGADFGRGLMTELPGVLYGDMIEHAPAATGDVQFIPIRQVDRAKAYADLHGKLMGQQMTLQRANLLGSDLCRPLRVALYPTPGLVVIDPDQQDVERVEGELMKELGADMVLRVHLRVGVYQGHATVEAGSLVGAVWKDRFGSLQSVRSLVSDESVVEPQPPGAATAAYVVDSHKYARAIRALAGPYLQMALYSTQEE